MEKAIKIGRTYRVLAAKGGDGKVQAFHFATEEAASDSQSRLKAAGYATSKQAPGTWAK